MGGAPMYGDLGHPENDNESRLRDRVSRLGFKLFAIRLIGMVGLALTLLLL